MHILKFIPIKLTLFLILGILIGHNFDFKIEYALLISLSLISALGFVFLKHNSRKSIAFGLICLATITSIGVFGVTLWSPKNHPNHYSSQQFKVKHTWRFKVHEVLKSSSYSDRYVLKVMSMDDNTSYGKVLFILSKNSIAKKLKIDDEFVTYAALTAIKPPLNLYQFDYRNYLKNLGIYHQLRLKSKQYVLLKNRSKTVFGLAATLRNNIISKLKQANFEPEQLAVIQALLLGQRKDISEDTYNDYINAGAVHILAVSGLHIGIILIVLQFLLQPLEQLFKSKTLKLLIIAVLLWCFAFLSGFSASVIRAVTMFSFVAYALYLNRPSNTFNLLALSMFFILLVINPMLLLQAGFQMSYAAVIAIVWLYPLLQRLWLPNNRILKNIWQLFSVSIAAQLGVLPISLFYFHQFPGLFFISNLLVVPFLGLILGVGILVIVLATLNLLPNFLVFGYNSLIGFMNIIIKWVAQQEVFLFRGISFDITELVISYLILIGATVTLTKFSLKRLYFVFLCIISFQLWRAYKNPIIQQHERLVIAHQTKTSLLLHQKASVLTVIYSDTLISTDLISEYSIAERLHKTVFKKMQNRYKQKGESILIIDNLGVYDSLPSDYILLTKSPKLNLERLIIKNKPKMIIADGSNYHSYVQRWKQTCVKRKLPFHYTGEKGAYYLD